MLRKRLLFVLVMSGLLCACQMDVASPLQSSPSAQPTHAPYANSPQTHNAVKPVTTGPGILLAAWAGSATTSSLSQDDRLKNQQAEARAYTAPIGQLVTWSNPNSNIAGTVSPLRDSYSANGSYCRDFQQTLTMSGQQKQGYVQACQIQDGSWQVTKT